MTYTKENAMLAVKAFKEGTLAQSHFGEHRLVSKDNDVIFESCVHATPHFRYSSELDDFEMLDNKLNPCEPVVFVDFSKFQYLE